MPVGYKKIIGGQKSLMEFCRKSDGVIRKKLPGCIFAEKLVLEKGPPSLKLGRIKEKLQPLSSWKQSNSSFGQKLQPADRDFNVRIIKKRFL